ncbi:MAG: phosphonoacetaldehyde hydrolase [Acidobacteria bacterium]|nr:phosphonoacetaldehyde hydrolase [Acidobacteriota bacterium]
MSTLKAVIFDWAGTMVDHGSLAPIVVIEEAFAAHGLPLTRDEARGPMGLPKRDHLAALLALPRVAASWKGPDLDTLYAEFLPRQMEVLDRFTTLLPGALEVVQQLESEGVKIGTTTGYTRPMLEILIARAAEQGYRPESNFCPGDVGEGRPAPWMIFGNLQKLGVYPPSACIKIGDTPADVAEGLNAGLWTIGLTDTGNEEGDPSRLIAAGAHYLAPSVALCGPQLVDIKRRITLGERP